MSDDKNVHEAISKLIRALEVMMWGHEKLTRLRMAWACIRGRSVCYRMLITPHGIEAKTSNSFIVDNTLDGLTNFYGSGQAANQ